MAVIKNRVVICPVRDKMMVEEITLRTRPVSSGTECSNKTRYGF